MSSDLHYPETQDRGYPPINEVARKIPEPIFQEDPKPRLRRNVSALYTHLQ
jgi:hypothetical protein